jgi:hypothetical protein
MTVLLACVWNGTSQTSHPSHYPQLALLICDKYYANAWITGPLDNPQLTTCGCPSPHRTCLGFELPEIAAMALELAR